VAHPDPERGGPVVDVVARVYGMAPEQVAVTVIMNNGGWSATWVPLGLRHYERMAGAFDGYGELVEEPDALGPALDRAFEHGRATRTTSILNVIIDPAPEYFPGRYLGA
jgi:thiamine pyrophosphate-dependent acetolactate synthase large subunit-like protein